MKDSLPTLHITLECDSAYRYRCRRCKRGFVVRSRDLHENGGARCPECFSDDVEYWLSRRDRIMRFLMFYEAA